MGETVSRRERIGGLLLGTAVGDSVGLPAEGISRRRIGRLFPGRWRHRLLPGRGMISDDTEHTIFVAQCLLAHPDAVDRFARRLSWCLRWWFASLPAGIGLATLRSILRMWIGINPSRSGVHSAGNGPAMRSAIIGAVFANRPEQLESYVRAATLMTHTDPRALTAARAVAKLAAWVVAEELQVRPDLESFLALLRGCADQDDEWEKLVQAIGAAAIDDLSVMGFADRLELGKGITGYAYHTVPMAMYTWYRHFDDFERALSEIWNCGGDTDTVGAVLGALCGVTVGVQGIPHDWRTGIVDWPRGTKVLEALGAALSADIEQRRPAAPVRYFWPGVVIRNIAFLAVVLAHGFRRLAPPY